MGREKNIETEVDKIIGKAIPGQLPNDGKELNRRRIRAKKSQEAASASIVINSYNGTVNVYPGADN